MNGAELLTEFRQRRSEPAFEQLVRRYTDLVFSIAKRRLNSEPLAQEAAQSVFLRLASAAPKLPSEPALLGWLHRTTVHVRSTFGVRKPAAAPVKRKPPPCN